MAFLREFAIFCLLVLASSYPQPKENGHQGAPKKDAVLSNLKNALAKLTQQVKDYTEAVNKKKSVEVYHDDKLSLEQSLDAAVAEDTIKVKVGPVLEEASEKSEEPDRLDANVDKKYEYHIDKSGVDFDEYNAGKLEIIEDVPIKSEIVHPEIIKKEVPDKVKVVHPEIIDQDVSDEMMDQEIEMHRQEDEVKVGPVLEEASEKFKEPDRLDANVHDDTYNYTIDKSGVDFNEYSAGKQEITEDVPINPEIVHPEIIKKEVPDKVKVVHPEIIDRDVSDEMMDQEIQMHRQEDEAAHKAMAAIKNDLSGLIKDFKGMKSELVKVSNDEIRSTYKSKLDEVKFDIDDILLDFKEVKKHLASEFPSDGKSQNDEILDGQLSHDDMIGLLGDMNDMITNARMKVQEVRDAAMKEAEGSDNGKEGKEVQDAKKGDKGGNEGRKKRIHTWFVKKVDKVNAGCEKKKLTSGLCAAVKKAVEVLKKIEEKCVGENETAECTASKAELQKCRKEVLSLLRAAAQERTMQRILKVNKGCQKKKLTSDVCASAKKVAELLNEVKEKCDGGNGKETECAALKAALEKSRKEYSALRKAAAYERTSERILKANAERCEGTDSTSDICAALKKAIESKKGLDDKCVKKSRECWAARKNFWKAVREAFKLTRAEGTRVRQMIKEISAECKKNDGTSAVCVALKAVKEARKDYWKAKCGKTGNEDKCVQLKKKIFSKVEILEKAIEEEKEKGSKPVAPKPDVPPTDAPNKEKEKPGEKAGGNGKGKAELKKDEAANELLNLKEELNDVLTEFKELKGRLEKRRDEKTKGEKKISFPRMDELKSQLHLLTDEMKSFKEEEKEKGSKPVAPKPEVPPTDTPNKEKEKTESMREDYFADLTDDNVKVVEQELPSKEDDMIVFDEDKDLF